MTLFERAILTGATLSTLAALTLGVQALVLLHS